MSFLEWSALLPLQGYPPFSVWRVEQSSGTCVGIARGSAEETATSLITDRYGTIFSVSRGASQRTYYLRNMLPCLCPANPLAVWHVTWFRLHGYKTSGLLHSPVDIQQSVLVALSRKSTITSRFFLFFACLWSSEIVDVDVCTPMRYWSEYMYRLHTKLKSVSP